MNESSHLSSQETLASLVADFAVLDSTVSKMAFSVDHVGQWNLRVVLTCSRRSKFALVELEFRDVRRFDFALQSTTDDLLIERYKALEIEGLVYFSLDPFDEYLLQRDSRDGMVIESESVSIFSAE